MRALDTYRQVLVKNEGNIYAANGIGAAIAELGDYNTAQKVFMMVRPRSMAITEMSLICDTGSLTSLGKEADGSAQPQ